MADHLAALRAYLAANPDVKRLEMHPRDLAKVRKLVGLKDDEEFVVSGIPVVPLDLRGQALSSAIAYAGIRWGVDMNFNDVDTLTKAVPTEELMSLAPLIIDQELDGRNCPDPADEMDEEDIKTMKEALKGHGFDNVEV